MKVLKDTSDFAQRVENVFRAMEENGVAIIYECGQFRVSDTINNQVHELQDMPLIDADDKSDIQELPPIFEYKLKVFDS